MQNSTPGQTQQGSVSKPVIQRYVDRILSGETNSPAIHVDGDIIVNGNHRYIAGRIAGIEIQTQSWYGGKPEKVISWFDVIIDSFDWGNN